MASSGNFATMNNTIQLGGSDDDRSSGYTENGNLKVNVIKQKSGPCSSIGIRTSGKYYFEVYVNSFFGGTNVALVNESWNIDAQPGWQTPSQNTSDYDLVGYYFGNGNLNNAQSAGDGSNFTSYGSALTGGSVLGVAVDVDNGKVWFHKDGTYPNSGNPATGANPARGSGGTITTAMDFTTKTWFVTAGGWGQTTGIITYNFGQDSTFGGEISAGGNADGNGFGDFKYSVPSGFLALCTANLPISDDIDPAQTDDSYPGKQFNVTTWTGNSTNDRAISLDMAPDLVIIKERGVANNWYWYDSIRGASYGLFSNIAQAQAYDTSELKSFTSTGFTLGTGGGSNNNSDTYCGWGWKCNGGTTASNSDGDITSTVQANTKAGFSIVKWTSNNQSNQDIGHGLSAAPRFIISKPYSASTWSWHVFHHYLGSIGNFQLNNGNAFSSGANTYGAMPTSSVFRVGTTGNLMPNNTGTDCISYCWHDVEGLQKFSTYTGNGNADGPFIYTGFRPRLLVIKKGSGSNDWVVIDTARNNHNPASKVLRWESSAAETSSNREIDILSNGFKPRTTNDVYNGSGGTYAYMAWGDVPFKYNNTF